MKKILFFLFATFVTGSLAYSQPFELGLTTGTSVNSTCHIDIGTDVSYLFSAAQGLELGFGAGVRYARPICQFIHHNRYGNEYDEINYAIELAAPIYGRARYTTRSNLFLQVDAGYRIALIDLLWGFQSWPLSGEYYEPQVGYKFDIKRSLTLGCSIQHCPLANRLDLEGGSGESYYSFGKNELIKIWRPIIFVRYFKKL